MVKRSIQGEDIAIVNIYAPNIGAPQHIRQTLTDLKGEIASSTIIVGDFNTSLTPMGSISSNVSFKTCVSLFIFCFDDLSLV